MPAFIHFIDSFTQAMWAMRFDLVFMDCWMFIHLVLRTWWNWQTRYFEVVVG